VREQLRPEEFLKYAGHTTRIGLYLIGFTYRAVCRRVFLLLVALMPPPGDLSQQAWWCLGLLLLMATWWSTQALPIPVTSLVPIVLASALGLESVREVTSHYAHPIIFLFLGGFMLGLAMQRWQLHRRLALHILLLVGHVPRRQIAGLMLATAFLSMWVFNTATTIMMLPIALSFFKSI